jgi:hypothetical protein
MNTTRLHARRDPDDRTPYFLLDVSAHAVIRCATQNPWCKSFELRSAP